MYLFFDTETNGLPRSYSAPASPSDNWPRIVQLAWVLCDEMGETKQTGDFIIRPDGFHIPPEATAIHGITEEIALSRGVPLDEALSAFDRCLPTANHLVAHNLEFDQRVLASEYLRRGRAIDQLIAIPTVCTMRGATKFCALPGTWDRYKWPKLTELHTTLFGSGFDGAHDALSDVEACRRCFFELRDRGVF